MIIRVFWGFRGHWMALIVAISAMMPSGRAAHAQDPVLPTAEEGRASGRDKGLLAFPRALGGRLRQTIPLTSLFVPTAVESSYGVPGKPAGRPRPGSRFDPGAGGPGISQGGDQNFLAGAFNRKTGWPFVLLDHYRPRPERMGQVWIVETRDCPQVMGSDPRPGLKVLGFDAEGRGIRKSFADLLAAAAGHPVLIQIQGSLTTPDAAFGGLIWTHSWLQQHHALPPDAVVIAFDWPSQRVFGQDLRDINEKGRRAFVAAYHLAVVLSAFPAGSRVTLIGQSYGGRVVPATLHLLGGGELRGGRDEPTVCLGGSPPDLRVRAVIIAAASDRHWLNPGERLDRALVGCEGLLNLYNHKDEALLLYPSLIRSDHHRAIGRIGLSRSDLARLGPLASRYQEYDVHDHLGVEHTLLDAVANPQIARRIAPYAWAADPGPAPPQAETPPGVAHGLRGRLSR